MRNISIFAMAMIFFIFIGCSSCDSRLQGGKAYGKADESSTWIYSGISKSMIAIDESGEGIASFPVAFLPGGTATFRDRTIVLKEAESVGEMRHLNGFIILDEKLNIMEDRDFTPSVLSPSNMARVGNYLACCSSFWEPDGTSRMAVIEPSSGDYHVFPIAGVIPCENITWDDGKIFAMVYPETNLSHKPITHVIDTNTWDISTTNVFIGERTTERIMMEMADGYSYCLFDPSLILEKRKISDGSLVASLNIRDYVTIPEQPIDFTGNSWVFFDDLCIQGKNGVFKLECMEKSALQVYITFNFESLVIIEILPVKYGVGNIFRITDSHIWGTADWSDYWIMDRATGNIKVMDEMFKADWSPE